MSDTLMSEFGLEVNLSETFGMNCETLSKDDIAKLLDIEMTGKLM